jgi:predicted AAA+ superfamily ATPase
MRQIFGAAVALPAQVISLQKLQGATQEKGTVPTIGHYLSLLGEAFLVTGLQKYSKSQFRARKSIPKLIVHDNGLCRAFERPVTGDLTPERFGRYLENAVGARLIEAGWETYYWKHRDDEVDFVAIGPENQRWAIEVKQSRTTASELKGLFRFCSQNPEFEPCLLSLTEQKIDGVRILDPKKVLALSRTF